MTQTFFLPDREPVFKDGRWQYWVHSRRTWVEMDGSEIRPTAPVANVDSWLESTDRGRVVFEDLVVEPECDPPSYSRAGSQEDSDAEEEEPETTTTDASQRTPRNVDPTVAIQFNPGPSIILQLTTDSEPREIGNASIITGAQPVVCKRGVIRYWSHGWGKFMDSDDDESASVANNTSANTNTNTEVGEGVVYGMPPSVDGEDEVGGLNEVKKVMEKSEENT